MAIKGTIIRKFNVRKTIKGTKAARAKGYAKMAKVMQADLKAVVSTPGPPPSTSGNPPHKVTGRLQRSVKVLARKDGTGVTIRSIKYGVYLEDPLDKNLKRKWVRPTIAANRAKYGKIVRDVVQKDANQKAKRKKRRR